jgi:hypothetical protein
VSKSGGYLKSKIAELVEETYYLLSNGHFDKLNDHLNFLDNLLKFYPLKFTFFIVIIIKKQFSKHLFLLILQKTNINQYYQEINSINHTLSLLNQ